MWWVLGSGPFVGLWLASFLFGFRGGGHSAEGLSFGAVSGIAYVMLGTVLRGLFRDTNFAYFVAFSLAVSHLPGDTGFLAVQVSAVEGGGKLSSTLNTSNLWVCCRACLWVLLWWFGWQGDQTLGWETVGVVKVWGSGYKGWCFGAALVGRPPASCAVFFCFLFCFFWGWPGSSESRADGMGGLLVCSVTCAVLLLILSS